MRSQISTVGISHIWAQFTFVRFFSRVCVHVFLDQGSAVEPFSAAFNGTLVWLKVAGSVHTFLVHDQIRGAKEQPTVRTRTFLVHRTAVFNQSPLRRIPATALVALELSGAVH